MTELSVNLNKVALLRNQRDIGYPSVLETARTVIAAGAYGITAHPRPDERHIRRSDVTELAAMLRAEYRNAVEFNVEGYPTPEFLALVAEVRPTQVTLVPDAPDQKTSDHGWDIPAHEDFLRDVLTELKSNGSRTALFVDPDPVMAVAAAAVGAERVELYTEPYAAAFGGPAQERVLADYLRTADAARDAGLGVNAGHDLNLENLPRLIADIPWILEVSIGHAITADALKTGFAQAVADYLAILRPRAARPVAAAGR